MHIFFAGHFSEVATSPAPIEFGCDLSTAFNLKIYSRKYDASHALLIIEKLSEKLHACLHLMCIDEWRHYHDV